MSAATGIASARSVSAPSVTSRHPAARAAVEFAAVGLASHALIFPWPEDGISLPHRLSFTVAHLAPQAVEFAFRQNHLAFQMGVELTELSKSQAEYLDVDVAGPYKPDHYRY